MAKKEAKKEAKHSKGDAKTSKEEQIGFHKGSLMTLSKERQELARIITIVEQLMQMHANALSELGVKLDAAQTTQPVQKSKKPPIEDIL